MSPGAKWAIGIGVTTALAIGADFLFCKGKHVKNLWGKLKGNNSKPNDTTPGSSKPEEFQRELDDYFQEEANNARRIAESDARNQNWVDDVHRRMEQEYSDFWNNALDEEARILKPKLDNIMENFNTVQHKLNDLRSRMANGETLSIDEMTEILKEYKAIKDKVLKYNSRASVQGYFDNIAFEDFSDLEHRISNYRIYDSIVNGFDYNYRRLFEHYQEYGELPQDAAKILSSVNTAARCFQKPVLKEEKLLQEQVQAIIDRNFKPTEALRQELSELDFRGTDLKDFENEINSIIQQLRIAR